jgi:seryl-tRNA(Sec) selenium transferase
MLAAGVLGGVPHQGFGRSMKVGREEIVGLVVALRRYLDGDDAADLARWDRVLGTIAERIADLPHVTVQRQFNPAHPIPRLRVNLDETALGFSAYDAVNRLLEGDPAIAVAQDRAEFATVSIDPHGLTDDEADTVASCLRAVLTA